MTTKSKSSGKTTIKIPTPLYEKLSLLIDGAGYNSVTDFVVYVLRDLAGEREMETAQARLAALRAAAQEEGTGRGRSRSRTQRELDLLQKTWKEQVDRAKDKLKSLGYL